mmetsp:Transcript_35164/g.84928  ORF Transcript_35164/g.84928 Transcript_35164/m.84928 type:complete len:239 (+) Transcript_35164:52-768(+)
MDCQPDPLGPQTRTRCFWHGCVVVGSAWHDGSRGKQGGFCVQLHGRARRGLLQGSPATGVPVPPRGSVRPQGGDPGARPGRPHQPPAGAPGPQLRGQVGLQDLRGVRALLDRQLPRAEAGFLAVVGGGRGPGGGAACGAGAAGCGRRRGRDPPGGAGGGVRGGGQPEAGRAAPVGDFRGGLRPGLGEWTRAAGHALPAGLEHAPRYRNRVQVWPGRDDALRPRRVFSGGGPLRRVATS